MYQKKIKNEYLFDLAILRNKSKTHYSDITVKNTEKLDTILTFLPPYLPHSV
jgi:hypothetical protein